MDRDSLLVPDINFIKPHRSIPLAMSEFAFNNYCLTCNKQCHFSQVYCSDDCKNKDELSTASFEIESLGPISPLLTPVLVQNTEIQHDDIDYFNLNLSKSLSDFLDILPSTSCNYRKWVQLN